MKPEPVSPPSRHLVWLVAASFAILAFAVVLRLGIDATPDVTTDSQGRPMGFNDPLGAEHFAIIIANFRPAALFAAEHAYLWVLIAAHFAAAALLLFPRIAPARFTRWFFILQPVVFPVGVVALPFLLMLGFSLAGTVDREFFIDVPFIGFVADPAWIIASMVIAWKLWDNKGFRFRKNFSRPRESQATGA